MGQTVLALLAVGMSLLAFGLWDSQLGRTASVLGLLAISGTVLPTLLGDLFVMPEMWAGILIGLSAAAYGTDGGSWAWRRVGGTFPARAVGPLVPDLPGARRPRAPLAQRGLWAVGLAAYGVYFAVHVAAVLPLVSEHDIAHEHGWVRLGGAGFVISIAQVNAWLLLLPQWVTALYLVAALVGAAGWSSPAGQRIGLGVAGYALAFAIVGQPFNQYWGSLTAPLFALAVGAFPAGCRRLVRGL